MAGAYAGDTIKSDNPSNTFYGVEGGITTCDDSFPHYHFSVSELKFVTKHVLVGRPGGLYIADVPVMWLPFVSRTCGTGGAAASSPRISGSASWYATARRYRRHVENVGLLLRAQRLHGSRRRGSIGEAARGRSLDDPGWTRYSGVFRYHWLDRFIAGSFGMSYQTLSNNTTNTAISWQHQQDFSLTSHLNMNINYETSTAIQQTTYFNPYAVLAMISSQLNYQQALGPANSASAARRSSIRVGRRSTGRSRRSASRRSRSAIGKWFTWTPSFSGDQHAEPERR